MWGQVGQVGSDGRQVWRQWGLGVGPWGQRGPVRLVGVRGPPPPVLFGGLPHGMPVLLPVVKHLKGLQLLEVHHPVGVIETVWFSQHFIVGVTLLVHFCGHDHGLKMRLRSDFEARGLFFLKDS